MDILEKAVKILHHPVCDHCLGRQFAQLGSGFTNSERGRLMRSAAAMTIDMGKDESKEAGHENKMDMSNFAGFMFHNREAEKHQPKKCSVCLGFFQDTDRWVAAAGKAAKRYEFKTFLIGTKLSHDMINAEESLWERVGIDYCEPIKAEINREIGKIVERRLKIKFSKSPDVNIILNIAEGNAVIEVNPVFIYGEYQKLARGLPQTKWPSRKYRTSVEQLIAKPFMKATHASAHKLHGLGREDIDARCLGWRPFVLELLRPRKRGMDLARLAKRIDKRVRVRKARPSDIAEVRRIKESKAEKTYTMLVESEKPLEKRSLSALNQLKSIKQKTPQRVMHRRADKFRTRAVRSISAKFLSKNRFRLTIRCEAGLYVKELVSGDSGRTQPSVSQILDNNCRVMELDIIGVHAR